MNSSQTEDVAIAEQGPARGLNFAKQALATAEPWLPDQPANLRVLDVGCNRGFTTMALGQLCKEVVGIEPSNLVEDGMRRLAAEPMANVTFRRQLAEDLPDVEAYDFVVLDNVYEHMPNQSAAMDAIVRALKPGGVLYLVAPNKLWPIEIHYYLPFLSYLPLSLANRYLRWSGRGTDFTDCSYAPTYWGLKRQLRRHPSLSYRFVVPARLNWTALGTKWHYRLGVRMLRTFPFLWSISKAFLVVAKKASH